MSERLPRVLATALVGMTAITSLLACSSPGASNASLDALAVASTDAATLPDWYVEAPRDSEDTLFGVGSAAGLPGAKTAALIDISGRLVVSVSTTRVERTVWQGSTLDQRIETETLARVGHREFQGYEVVKSALVGETFFVLVRVDRARLFRDTHAAYRELDWETSNRLEAAMKQSPFEYYAVYRRVAPDLERVLATALLLHSIDARFDQQADVERHRAYRKRYEWARRQLVFTLLPDESSDGLGQVVQELLSKEGFRTQIRKQGECAEICIEISSTATNRYAARRYLSTVSAVFRVREGAGTVAASRQHEMQGTALAGHSEANGAALRNFRDGFAEEGILNVLGL
jgi:hypothetical protein